MKMFAPIGSLGAAASRRLSVVFPPAAFSDPTPARDDFVVVLGSHACDAELSVMQHRSTEHGFVFYPVRLIADFVVAGPAMGPSRICYECVRKRVLARMPDPNRLIAIWRDEDQGGQMRRGFTPAMVDMYASLAEMASPDDDSMIWFGTIDGDVDNVRPLPVLECGCSSILPDVRGTFQRDMETLLR